METSTWLQGPDAWQEYCIAPLKRHHGPTNFQEVPDRHGGDFGVEGFSRDGRAYQCYCPEGLTSPADLCEKQERKVYTDLKKFRDNRNELERLFGPTVIDRWVLLVPRFESATLIQYAETQAAKVRNENLRYVSPTFTAQICTQSAFQVEAQQLAGVGVVEIGFDLDTTSTPATVQTSLLSNLDRKLQKLGSISSEDQATLATEFIKDYLDGQNLLEQYHANYPDIYKAARTAKTQFERFLKKRSLMSPAAPRARLSEELSNFKNTLEGALPGVKPYNIEHLSHEAVADWLLRCPLDFP